MQYHFWRILRMIVKMNSIQIKISKGILIRQANQACRYPLLSNDREGLVGCNAPCTFSAIDFWKIFRMCQQFNDILDRVSFFNLNRQQMRCVSIVPSGNTISRYYDLFQICNNFNCESSNLTKTMAKVQVNSLNTKYAQKTSIYKVVV